MLFLVFFLALQSDPTLHQQFLELERSVTAGLHEKDADHLDSLLSPRYVLRGRPDIDRSTWIQNAVTLCWGDRSEIEEFNVREAEGTVLTSFVLTMHQDPLTCNPATVRSLITDVWVREGGEWRLVMRHSGPIGGANGDPIAQQFLREEAPPPRWEATSELSFVSTGGNADTQTLGVGSEVTYRAGPWVTAGSAGILRSSADGRPNARSLTAQIRQSAQLSPRIDIFARTDYRRDLFAGIEHRGTLDSGLGFKLLDTPAQQFRIDSGLGYIHEERSTGPRLSSAILNSVNTWQWQLLPNVTVSNSAGITMPFEQTEAWRLRNQLSLTTALTEMFAIRVSHTTNYLNRPVLGFGGTDTIISAALVTKFRRQ